MNIYAALKKDHDQLERLLDQLVAASKTGKEGSDDWKRLANEIRDILVPHSRVEEALFYNPLRETEHGKEVVLHSYEEHALAETELRALQAMSLIDLKWTTLAEKLRNDVLHHVEEEESKVFAAAKLLFDEDEAENLGEAFEQIKPQVKEQSMLGTSIDLVLNLLPEKSRERVRATLSKFKKKAA